jgi:hypothetical protein
MNKKNKSTEIRINGEIAGKYLFLLLIRVFSRFLRLDPDSEISPGKHAFIVEFVKTGER